MERNLGYEAEHHKRALGDIPGVSFYVDQKANRVGVLTTEATIHAMATLVVSPRLDIHDTRAIHTKGVYSEINWENLGRTLEELQL